MADKKVDIPKEQWIAIFVALNEAIETRMKKYEWPLSQLSINEFEAAREQVTQLLAIEEAPSKK